MHALIRLSFTLYGLDLALPQGGPRGAPPAALKPLRKRVCCGRPGPNPDRTSAALFGAIFRVALLPRGASGIDQRGTVDEPADDTLRYG